MTKLFQAFRWALVLFLCLSIPSALADSINTIAGQATLDQSSPRVWRHGTSVPTNTSPITTSATQYAPMVFGGVYGCDGTCAQWNPVLQKDPDSDGDLASDNALYTFSALQGFNGTTFDRLRATQNDNQTTGILNAGNMVLNGGTLQWNRERSASGDALSDLGMPAAGNMLFNGTTWDRKRTAADSATVGFQGVVPEVLNTTSNGPTTDGNANRTVGAGSQSFNNTAIGGRVPFVVQVSTWSVTNTPATATQATASRAAGAAGVRHVATTVSVCIAAGGTAQTPILVNLRDGATGAGTILRSWAFSAPVNTSQCADLSGLAMAGTAATAMTIEFAAAGVAASQQTVTLTGFSTQ